MSVWAVTQVQCKNEAFNYVNGDVFVWKNLWADLAGYFEADVRPSYGMDPPILISEIR